MLQNHELYIEMMDVCYDYLSSIAPDTMKELELDVAEFNDFLNEFTFRTLCLVRYAHLETNKENVLRMAELERYVA